jgi:hypothetical protein
MIKQCLEVFMKFTKKTGLVLILAALLALPLSAQSLTGITDFSDKIDGVAQDLGKTMITNAGFGLNWSDAYIGQLLGLPPHFGIGASVSFTAVPASKIDPVYKEFDSAGILDSANLPVNFLPLPAVAGEIRIGGFFLPFDIGIKALPLPTIDRGDLKLKYTMVGGDLRYALMQGKGLSPAISIGVGFTYTDFSLLSTSVGNDTVLDLSEMASGYSGYGTGSRIKITAPDLDFAMKNTTMDFKVQISKKLFIITPYLGLGLSYGWSTVDFGANSRIQYSNDGTTYADLTPQQIADIKGFTGIDIPSDSSSLNKSVPYSGLGFRGFGGLSINIFVLKIDLTGLYDIVNQNWGAGVGIRVQI